jgi:hypothetical protein
MTTTHRTTTTALLILSLAAAGAPAASAMPIGGEPASAAKPAPAVVYSRQDKSTIPATAPSTAAGTAANDGSPSPPTTSGPRSEVVSGGGYGFGTAAPTVIRVVDGNSGFDWADAAIGAAGGIVLSMLGLGGAHGVSQYRTRSTRHTAALSG